MKRSNRWFCRGLSQNQYLYLYDALECDSSCHVVKKPLYSTAQSKTVNDCERERMMYDNDV